MTVGTAKNLATATALAVVLSFGGGAAHAQSAGEVWAVTHDTDSVAILEAYIEAFPDTAYARLAQARIQELRGDWTGPSAEEPVEPNEPETEEAGTQATEAEEAREGETEVSSDSDVETVSAAEPQQEEPQVSEPQAAEPEEAETETATLQEGDPKKPVALDVETAKLHLVTTGADYWNHSARGGTVALIHGDGSLSIARTGSGKATRLKPAETL